MKLKIILILLILAALNVSPSNNQTDKKLDAFTASIKYETSKDYNNAIKELENIYNDFLDDYLVNLRLGWLYYLNGKQDLAIKYYNIAKNLSDESIESLLGLTLPYSAKGNWDKVKDIYKQILSKDPLNYTANYRLGEIYFNSQDYLNAKKSFSIIYSNYPSDYNTSLYLGWVYYYLGSYSKAKELFVNTLILNPGNQSAQKGLDLVK